MMLATIMTMGRMLMMMVVILTMVVMMKKVVMMRTKDLPPFAALPLDVEHKLVSLLDQLHHPLSKLIIVILSLLSN